MEKLKPCPFCGEQPTFDDEIESHSLLYCKNCYENSGRTVDVVAESTKKAVESWNTRVIAKKEG